MGNKKITIIISIILILNLIFIIYLTSFNINTFNQRFYEKEFEKYDIYNEFPNKDIDKINSDLLLYLKGERDNFNKELFNQDEINHLEDVKILIQKINVFYYLTLIVLIFLIMILFLLNKKYFLGNLSIILFFSGLLTLFSIIFLLVLIKLNFDNVFTIFHYIFFPQGNWLFSSSNNIIKLYPTGFFYEITKKIFITILIYANILILAAILLFFCKKCLTSQH